MALKVLIPLLGVLAAGDEARPPLHSALDGASRGVRGAELTSLAAALLIDVAPSRPHFDLASAQRRWSAAIP